MSTIEELERREAEVHTAEGMAVGVLAAAMREVAVQLPDGSRLALTLARGARKLDFWARPTHDAELCGGLGITLAVNEIVREQAEQWGVDTEDAA